MDSLDDEVFKQCKSITNGLISEIRQGNIEKQKTIKYLTIALIVSISFIAITNMAWLYVANQYEYVEADSGSGGNASYIGEDSVIINGESKSCSEKSNPPTKKIAVKKGKK